MDNLEQKVKNANKDFYNLVGNIYEEIDGRRTIQLKEYLKNELKFISQKTDGESIIDLGAGTGFVSKISKEYFKKIYALDISFKMLTNIKNTAILKTIGDVNLIPFQTEKISAVASFSVLHHCYSFEKIFAEIYRILKKGGVFYSDHDLDIHFFGHFVPLLKLYRLFHNLNKKYLSYFPEMLKDTYSYAEFNNNGISSQEIVDILQKVGFKDISVQYHWYGLSSLTNKLFGKNSSYKKGFAPLIKIIAIK